MPNKFELIEPILLPKPLDIPDDYIGYNPSAIWTTEDKKGRLHDIMYVRVEPDHFGRDSSHLGKSISRPYEINLADLREPLKPYPEADEQIGEDPALTRINRRLASGAIEKIWLLSCVDARPYPFKPSEVRSLKTRFYAGTELDHLEHIADGPENMKDIRVAQSISDETTLQVYGRPRVERENNGNIAYTTIDGIEDLDEQAILDAQIIDNKLFPRFGNLWGGVNEVFPIDADKNLLLGHRAWAIDPDAKAVHYEAVIFEHYVKRKRIVDLGVLATSNTFPMGHVKDNVLVDTTDVVFPGGGYNGALSSITFGLRDGEIGLGMAHKLG